MANLKIKLVKSLNGRLEKHIATAESLGLRKIGQVTIQPDNTQTRGKIASSSEGNWKDADMKEWGRMVRNELKK